MWLTSMGKDFLLLFYFARAELVARDVARGEKMSCFIMSIILELPLGYHQT